APHVGAEAVHSIWFSVERLHSRRFGSGNLRRRIVALVRLAKRITHVVGSGGCRQVKDRSALFFCTVLQHFPITKANREKQITPNPLRRGYSPRARGAFPRDDCRSL